MSLGMHHHRKRKRPTVRPEQKLNTVIDSAVYVMTGIALLANIPQLVNIWGYGKTEGVSVITWSGFALGSLFWLWYGLIHKEMPIVVTNIAAFLIQVSVVVGIVIYTV